MLLLGTAAMLCHKGTPTGSAVLFGLGFVSVGAGTLAQSRGWLRWDTPAPRVRSRQSLLIAMEHLLVGLTSIVILGIAAQWLSWRLRLPSILLLLLVRFVAGPVTGFIRQDRLLGDVLFPIVLLSVAVILFEGGLSLDIAELPGIGRVVRNLMTVGVAVTWILCTGFALLLLHLGFGLALLFGAVLVVTGPTVIIPLLCHIRPNSCLASVMKWEGIANDPIGAILGVLVFEAVIAGGLEAGLSKLLTGILAASVIGGGLGLAGAARRRHAQSTGHVPSRRRLLGPRHRQDAHGCRYSGIPQHLRGRFLFAEHATYDVLAARHRSGAIVKATTLSNEFDFGTLQEHYGEGAIPLFAVKDSGEVQVFTARDPPNPSPGRQSSPSSMIPLSLPRQPADGTLPRRGLFPNH